MDRALLDFCLDHLLERGGWCPAERKAEDGTIGQQYPLKELPGSSYKERTAANVRESEWPEGYRFWYAILGMVYKDHEKTPSAEADGVGPSAAGG